MAAVSVKKSIATGITKCDEFITNCDRYYKVRWLLRISKCRVWQGTVSHCQKEKQCAVANCQILCMVI